MRKIFILLFAFTLISTISFSQNKGKVIEERTVKSTALGRAVKYTIYFLQIMKFQNVPIPLFIYCMGILMITPGGYNLVRSIVWLMPRLQMATFRP